MTSTPIRVLTGITTTGTPHLGNYVGAIRPAIQASRDPGTQSYFFLADYHALIKCDDPQRIQRSTLEIAASWLAAGLDAQQVTFYRQSDIPEITELMWLLTCVSGKGLLNRAHAYKASVDKNLAASQDPDADVTAGLFMYPVLMAADILMFQAQRVPVGRDQLQHIEMARDIASSFNHLYGEHLVLPQALIDEQVATLPGLDGRKMSKSYNNTIPLFSSSDQLRKLINGLLTDSRAPGEPKDPEGSALLQIYQAFADGQQTEALRQAYAEGIAWGDAKALLFEQVEASVAPMREHYQQLLAQPKQLEDILQEGAAKARRWAVPYLKTLREAAGLRPLGATLAASPSKPAAHRNALPLFKQYREADGLFYFKLSLGEQPLLQSLGHADPKAAAALIGRLKKEGYAAYSELSTQFAPLDEHARADLQTALAELQAAQ
jgi:tryptophanyl-tRNA synthetase